MAAMRTCPARRCIRSAMDSATPASPTAICVFLHRKFLLGEAAEVNVDVTNTGKRAGVETVQLYLHERYTPVAIPVKNLRGFQRVTLNPGETKTVTMKLTPDDLMLLDEDMHWKVVPGTFDVMIGKSSADIVLHEPLEVQMTNASESGDRSSP